MNGVDVQGAIIREVSSGETTEGWGRTHPKPNSSQFAFPTMVAPASRKSRTDVASKGEVNSDQGLERPS